MQKSIIAVDFDDVVADFNRPFAEFHNGHFGSNITYDDVTDFNMCLIYQIDRSTFVERAMHFCHEYHNTMSLIPGAQEALVQLQDRFELHIVTSRWNSLETITRQWLNQNLPGMFTDVHFVNQNDSQERPKSTLCHEIGAKLLIDDAWHHIADAAQNNLGAILMNRPWNQAELPANAVRVYNWEDTTARVLAGDW